MIAKSIYLALIIALLCHFASAQRVQTSGPRDRQIPHLPLMGTNISQETPREMMGLITRLPMQSDLIRLTDSLRASRIQPPLPDGRFIPNRTQRSLNPFRVKLPTQSQFYVIDTAIVRSTYDTTRHLYSFNADAKRTSHLTQELIGDLWVNSLCETSTYDATNKTLSELEENWSNGQWVNDHRYTYTYDAQGNMLTYSSEHWGNGQWGVRIRYTWTYDAQGNMLSELYEQDVTYQLVIIDRTTYTYDAQGNMLTELHEARLGGQLVNEYRRTYTYDAQTHMLTKLSESWRNGQWENTYRNTYTYDTNGNETSYSRESWHNGQWENRDRYTYIYDANGNKLSELLEHGSHSQWVSFIRDTYTYDASNNMLTRLGEGWRYGQWENRNRATCTYDAQGNMLTDLYEEWLNGQWVNCGRTTYTYDAQGNRLTELHERRLGGQLVNEYRRTYTYDANGNLTSFWNHSWLNDSWVPTNIDNGEGYEPVVVTLTDSAGNYYWCGNGYNFTFSYKMIVTGVVSESGNGAASYSLSQNYPNPFNPNTTITYELPKSSQVDLAVYDMLGREVSVLVNGAMDAGNHQVKFDASGLSSGVYFYRLQAGDFVQSKRMVILK